MSLNYNCPRCGTPLGYEGLCWKCKCEQERNAALAWTPEQVAEKQENLVQNIRRLSDFKDPEHADFWQLLSYRDAITPEIQRSALAAEVFWPCEIYYHAPADVRDGLIAALLKTEDSHEAGNLMSCLAFQGDDRAMETLLELERNPRPWRKGLYVDPSSYAQIGGWTFDREWSRESPARYPPSVLAVLGRTPAPTAAGGWWICWCWTAGTSGSGSWGWTAS